MRSHLPPRRGEIPAFTPSRSRYSTPEGCKAELTYVTQKRTSWKLNPRPVSRKSNTLPQQHHATKINSGVTTNSGPVGTITSLLGPIPLNSQKSSKGLCRHGCILWFIGGPAPRGHGQELTASEFWSKLNFFGTVDITVITKK